MGFSLRAIILAFCGVILLVTPLLSAERPFYQGKTVTFLINFAAGGPTDIEGRILRAPAEVVDFVRQYIDQVRKWRSPILRPLLRTGFGFRFAIFN